MTPEQKRKRDLAAEAFAKTGEDIGACEQSFRVGYDQGFAEGRAEIERLERELAEAKRMLDYERSAVDRLMECEANEAAQKGQYRAKVERLTAERDEMNDHVHEIRAAIDAKSENVCNDIRFLIEERDRLKAELAEAKTCETLLNEPLREETLAEMIRRLDSWGYQLAKRESEPAK